MLGWGPKHANHSSIDKPCEGKLWVTSRGANLCRIGAAGSSSPPQQQFQWDMLLQGEPEAADAEAAAMEEAAARVQSEITEIEQTSTTYLEDLGFVSGGDAYLQLVSCRQCKRTVLACRFQTHLQFCNPQLVLPIKPAVKGASGLTNTSMGQLMSDGAISNGQVVFASLLIGPAFMHVSSDYDGFR